MSSEVQTMAALDSRDRPSALRTPLYAGISLLGLLIVVATFLPWAGVERFNGDGFATSVSGFDAGGWGLSALIVGLVIAALGVLGYLWNPFSDPEAALVAAFSAAALVAAVVKLFDSASLISGSDDFTGAVASPRVGLWVITIAAAIALLSGLWILYSRPKAERRLAAAA